MVNSGTWIQRESEFQGHTRHPCPLIQQWPEAIGVTKYFLIGFEVCSTEGIQAWSLNLAPESVGPGEKARTHVLLAKYVKLLSKYLYVYTQAYKYYSNPWPNKSLAIAYKDS